MRDAGLSTTCTLLNRVRQHLRSGALVEAAGEVPRKGGVRGGREPDLISRRIECTRAGKSLFVAQAPFEPFAERV